jgi:hypothetical protein
MMGERDAQKQLWNYQVNLDKRVRSDHPLRRINETLELDLVDLQEFCFVRRRAYSAQVVGIVPPSTM